MGQSGHPKKSPCTGCQKRSTCRSICEAVEALIPKADIISFEEISTDPSFMEAVNKANEEPEDEEPPLGWAIADLADAVRPHLEMAIRKKLTKRQKLIVRLFLEGHRQSHIAKRLRVKRVTVHWIIKRAKRAIQDWFGGGRVSLKKSHEYGEIIQSAGILIRYADRVIEFFPPPLSDQLSLFQADDDSGDGAFLARRRHCLPQAIPLSLYSNSPETDQQLSLFGESLLGLQFDEQNEIRRCA